MQNAITNENNETRTLFGICASNVNEVNSAKLTMDKFTISQSNYVILIIENDVVNIQDTERLSVNDSILTSFTISNYNGVILNYICHFILLLTAILVNINWKFTKGYGIKKRNVCNLSFWFRIILF